MTYTDRERHPLPNREIQCDVEDTIAAAQAQLKAMHNRIECLADSTQEPASTFFANANDAP